MKEYILKEENNNKITVRDVQVILLEMLKDINLICQKHNISYYLTGGSCLGAVRHQGFIPWDDDADIGMMYDDYVRFIAILKEELDPNIYYFQCFETHREYNVCIPVMKIRKKNTYLKEANKLLENRCLDGDGIFIDVFLIDYISESKIVDFSHRIIALAFMFSITAIENIRINPYRLKKNFVNFSRNYSLKNKESSLIGYDLNWTFNSPLKPIVYKKDDIFPVNYVKFEDEYLPIPKNPKALLDVEISVNHMNFPPEKMQKPKHIIDIEI